MRSFNFVAFFRPSLRAFVGCLVLGAISASAGFSSPVSLRVEESETEYRSIGEYRRDVKTFMKHSKSSDSQLERNAIFNLCELHRELVSDPRFHSNQQIQGFRVVVANRLETYAKDVKKEQLRAQRAAKNARKESSSVEQEDVDSGPDSTSVAQSDSFQGSPLPDPTAAEQDEMYQSSADAYHSLGMLSGGPNQLFGYAGGHLGPPWDHGQELVDLIQNTINPDFWRANGGNGVIHYFQPLRVLVIGASTQVHENTLDLLNQLRAAGQ